MEGNEEKELTVDELVSLPWHIVRLIISNFSPWDLLRFASSHPQFKALVQEQPKSHKSIESGTFSLELIRNGRLLYHTSAFIKYTEKMSLNRMKVKNKDTAYHANFFFQKNDDLKKDSYKILMTNAKVEQVMRARMEMIDWDFKAQELAYPDIKTLNELEEMIEKFSPSSVLLYKTLFFTKQDEFNRDVFLEFIASPKIHSLQCLYTYCTLPHLNYFTRVPIPKLRIQLQNSDDFQVFLSSFTEEIIQQWENNSREIDFIILKLPLTQNHGDNELENFLNFEINEMVRVLGYGRPGSFEGRGIDRRFKLIKRQDGVGLLLMTGALSVLLVRCDYNIRRNRGLGKMRECEELMNEVLKAARTMKHVSESTSKAQTVNETIPEPILDMVCEEIESIC
ncbi:unnamed protein product, partial [Mesorhabditis belari]|uniref:F-box domain-containing protein n=1 Tax=Mesorhabditis belari TaxID=2138241 RepID=A0AAF3F4R8_9BILA